MTKKILFLSLAIVSACEKPVAPPPPIVADSPTAPTWASARVPDTASAIESPAEVVPAAGGEGAVTPPLRAQVIEILVQPGAQVAAGAALFVVRLPEAATAASQAVAAAARLSAYEERARQLEALKAQGLARAPELSEVRVQIAESRGQQQVALTILRAAGLSSLAPEDVAQRGGRVHLHSPVAGVVTDVSALVGQVRDPDDGPLARVSGAGSRRVEARLLAPVSKGATFSFSQPGLAARPLRLVSMAAAGEGGGARRAWFDLEGGDPLPARTRGRVRATSTETQNALLVPVAAIRDQKGDPSVMVKAATGPARKTNVAIVSIDGALALVTGLNAGDEVALEPELPPEGAPK